MYLKPLFLQNCFIPLVDKSLKQLIYGILDISAIPTKTSQSNSYLLSG